ncbi:molybdenum ABC transporter ATP-binding protein [Tahibacter amnicola]|uniref:Molybdenum ABC transporter ATP-binding protein n=1 Tax=Tahibacter amnicola TaxID=2976241 RepID=A0ABY6BDG3_9GAMM|nr:molybdenum ABC transporter ATP-binding protein [Tahibacter amnicola]UXI66370.1 molybdenum ABC transporter ATP-binding protein [Tahibacter amnicola]
MTANSADAIHARFALRLGTFALDVDMQIPSRGVTALFGHSGSGKTTLLRCLAGLVAVPGGYLRVAGDVWQKGAMVRPTHRRPLGYVFQEASLFAHLSVRENLTYGQSRVPAAQRRVALDTAVELLGIGPLLDRRPEGLSGGERQRVAIARALAVSPRWLLMDEPLASLDFARKQEILPYLERLHDDLDIPVLYVSHAPDEIARLADHIVVLSEGQVVAQGDLRETLARLDLAGTFANDVGVVIEAAIAQHDDADHLTQLSVGAACLYVSRRPEAIGHRVRVRVHASDVSLSLQQPQGTSILNVLPAQVVELADSPVPGQVLVKLDLGQTTLIARISARSRDHLAVAPGQRLWAQIKSVALLR